MPFTAPRPGPPDPHDIPPTPWAEPRADRPGPPWPGPSTYPPYPGPLGPRSAPYAEFEQGNPGRPAIRTRYRVVLGAVGLVVLLHLAAVLILAGEPPTARGLGRVVGGMTAVGLLTSLAVWLVVRRRRWSLPILGLATLGVYVVLQLPVVAAAG